MLVKCFPRIHIGLMDMGDATARRYGGAGFALSCLPTEIVAMQSKRLNIRGQDKLDLQGQKDLLSSLQRLIEIVPSAKAQLTIKSLPPQHIGLGIKTALLLGAVTAASLSAGVRLPPNKLQEISGRGGASGVGVNTFFVGGFIADAGHRSSKENHFAPSSSGNHTTTPPVISRVKMPERWSVYLVLPMGHRVFGDSELKFFERNTPIPKSAVLKSLALLYHGVVPAILTQDLGLLKSSIAGLHLTGFKKLEMDAQSTIVQDMIRQLADVNQCAVGLSSMGPLIYIIADRNNYQIKCEVEQLCKYYKSTLLGTCVGRNRGFEVIK